MQPTQLPFFSQSAAFLFQLKSDINEEFPGLKTFLGEFLQKNSCMISSEIGRNQLLEKVFWALTHFSFHLPKKAKHTTRKPKLLIWVFVESSGLLQVLKIVTRLVERGYLGTQSDISWLSRNCVNLVNGQQDIPLSANFLQSKNLKFHNESSVCFLPNCCNLQKCFCVFLFFVISLFCFFHRSPQKSAEILAHITFPNQDTFSTRTRDICDHRCQVTVSIHEFPFQSACINISVFCPLIFDTQPRVFCPFTCRALEILDLLLQKEFNDKVTVSEFLGNKSGGKPELRHCTELVICGIFTFSPARYW